MSPKCAPRTPKVTQWSPQGPQRRPKVRSQISIPRPRFRPHGPRRSLGTPKADRGTPNFSKCMLILLFSKVIFHFCVFQWCFWMIAELPHFFFRPPSSVHSSIYLFDLALKLSTYPIRFTKGGISRQGKGEDTLPWG